MQKNELTEIMEEAVRQVVDEAEMWVEFITDKGKKLPIGVSPETKEERILRLRAEARMMPQMMAEQPEMARERMKEIDEVLGEAE